MQGKDLQAAWQTAERVGVIVSASLEGIEVAFQSVCGLSEDSFRLSHLSGNLKESSFESPQPDMADNISADIIGLVVCVSGGGPIDTLFICSGLDA